MPRTSFILRTYDRLVRSEKVQFYKSVILWLDFEACALFTKYCCLKVCSVSGFLIKRKKKLFSFHTYIICKTWVLVIFYCSGFLPDSQCVWQCCQFSLYLGCTHVVVIFCLYRMDFKIKKVKTRILWRVKINTLILFLVMCLAELQDRIKWTHLVLGSSFMIHQLKAFSVFMPDNIVEIEDYRTVLRMLILNQL